MEGKRGSRVGGGVRERGKKVRKRKIELRRGWSNTGVERRDEYDDRIRGGREADKECC